MSIVLRPSTYEGCDYSLCSMFVNTSLKRSLALGVEVTRDASTKIFYYESFLCTVFGNSSVYKVENNFEAGDTEIYKYTKIIYT